MEKRDKKIPYEVVIQERKRVDLYGNVVYYIYWSVQILFFISIMIKLK